MKRFMVAVIFVFISIQLLGCSGWKVHTSTSRQGRVDQEISGNRGYLFGNPVAPPKEPTFSDRKVYRTEVEIPEWKRKKKTKAAKEKSAQAESETDQEMWGNRGYLAGEEEPALGSEPSKDAQAPAKMPQKASPAQTYKVRKGDTLQSISQKFYGTTKKWGELFQANQDKLKSPDRIYPGQVIIIPGVGEFTK